MNILKETLIRGLNHDRIVIHEQIDFRLLVSFLFAAGHHLESVVPPDMVDASCPSSRVFAFDRGLSSRNLSAVGLTDPKVLKITAIDADGQIYGSPCSVRLQIAHCCPRWIIDLELRALHDPFL